MNIQEVIDRAQSDQKFAEDLHAKAIAASRVGPSSSEFETLLGEFAASPEELANLVNQQNENEGTTTTTTITTTGTITTLACTVTSTTTTTFTTTGAAKLE